MRICIITILSWLYSFTALHGQITDFDHIDFTKADSIAALYTDYTLLDIKNLSDKLTSPLSTPVEKFRSIYSWVSRNIENDYTLYTKNSRKRKKIKNANDLKAWNTEFSKEVFKALVNKHQTVCTGYAYLVRELAHHAGITVTIVDGYGRTAKANIGGSGVANHSWNAVLLNNKWYLCDATWSSGAIDLQNRVFIKKFDASYFLADPALFIRNHYPLDTNYILLDLKPSLDKFLIRPLTYTGIYDYGVTAISPDSFIIYTIKNQVVDFNFIKNSKFVEKAELLLVHSSGHTTPRVISVQNSETKLSFQHTFTSKGQYTAHILFDGNYICTFSVVIK